jgi:hypothetical protein
MTVDRSDELAEWYDEDHPDGAELCTAVHSFTARFVAYPTEHAHVAHTLWILHTWLMDAWESTPRIAFLSPEPGSGKSRALEVTEPLVPRPVHSVNTTPAYLFRKVSDEAGRPTILYDEIDTVFGPKAKDNEEIRGMINAGHRKGAMAGRCVMRGKTVETEELPAYCAVALAGLDDLPDTIMTRSVVIRMRRRAPDEHVEPWRERVNGPEAERLRTRIANWAADSAEKLVGDFWPNMPDEVTDRDADVWEALLAVSDLAGGDWPKRARKAAVTLVTASRQRKPSLGILLLTDLQKVFEASADDKLPTEDILAALNKMDESPWAAIRRGEPMDSRSLANRLGKYGIGSKAQRDGERVFKGYSRTQFEDAWKRYAPVPNGTPAEVVNPLPPDEPELSNALDSPPVQGSASVTPVTAVPELDVVTAVTDAKGPPVECSSCGREIPEHMHASRERGVCGRCIAVATAQERL